MQNETKVSIFVSRTCPACKPYIHQIAEHCEKRDYKYNITIIENNPILTYKYLNKARESGEIIDHAPFLMIEKEDKYKAIGGILDDKQLTKLFKKYG